MSWQAAYKRGSTVRLHQIKIARSVALPLLARFGNFDITIPHHHTGDPLRLNAFRHKGYWYLGKKREYDVMNSFQRLIREGDTVMDVGGHIGYISLYFSRLVGPSGHVVVFEPGTNNLPYTRANLQGKQNVVLIPQAVSNCSGKRPFYLEDVAGQNNSLVQDFWVFNSTQKEAFVDGKYTEVLVDVTTVDQFVVEQDLTPAFMKIDVEGAELEVLQGGLQTIQRHKPMLMLEVNVGHAKVYDFILRNGYLICDEKLHVLKKYQEHGMPNIFALHGERHAHLLNNL